MSPKKNDNNDESKEGDFESETKNLGNESSINERRGTFVGTAFYVSPEMLKDNVALPGSDLWALGCIIFKMLTGDVPFNGATDYKTF